LHDLGVDGSAVLACVVKKWDRSLGDEFIHPLLARN
jgi:hypothetical protein